MAQLAVPYDIPDRAIWHAYTLDISLVNPFLHPEERGLLAPRQQQKRLFIVRMGIFDAGFRQLIYPAATGAADGLTDDRKGIGGNVPHGWFRQRVALAIAILLVLAAIVWYRIRWK